MSIRYVVSSATLLLCSCSSETSRFGQQDATTSSPVDAGNEDGPVFGGSEAGPSKGGCSADLRSVVAADGTVVETCDENSGCSGGKCIAACEATAVSQGNIGCTFVVSTPSFISNRKPPCYVVFVANAWPKAAKLTVVRDGATFDVTQFGRIASSTGTAATWSKIASSGVPAGEVGVLFLSHDGAGCPVTPAVSTSTAVYTGQNAATGRGKAFRITTDVPVSAYDILPYGGATSFIPSAQLLFPATAWAPTLLQRFRRVPIEERAPSKPTGHRS